jgi:hypothetical protein
MYKSRISTALSIGSLLLVLTWSSPGWSFGCDSGKAGKGSCSCNGTSDCTDMRHSGMCGGTLSCSQGKCGCTAAIVVKNPGGGTVVKPVIVAPTSAASKAAQ